MTAIHDNETTLRFDPEGYLADAHNWTPEIGEFLAAREGITLTERHWQVIRFARKEYDTTGESPTLRKITKNSGVDTKEIYQLFPGGPAKIVAKIAGLKKPTGCI
ncbi:MAG TPA: TusE/DsrC/DsvC family sulfur relay protein [Aggregatilineales bacterium]|nr:TusE/DsrC/DsvC family sulfur relay protein [Anaerolineales bacterium]HRE49093.1 TusE/DsrC/DsvC family sulfur relay protein [Aggregatilineales bacterium]